MVCQTTAAALHALAQGFSAQGAHLAAVACLEALCKATGQLPVDEAATHLAVARLLLAHTHNVLEAKQHLERAQLVLNQVAGAAVQKSEVLAELARCWQYLGELRLQRQALQKALDLCRAAQGTSDGPVLLQWQCHLHLQLAKAHTCTADAAAAIASLDDAFLAATLIRAEEAQAVVALFRAQLRLGEGDTGASQEALQQAAACQARLPTSVPEPRSAQLRLHLLILTTLQGLASGATAQLQRTGQGEQKGVVVAVEELEGLLARVRGEAWPCHWLPAAGVEALALLLCCAVLRPAGKQRQCSALLTRAQQALDAHLPTLHLDLKAGEAGLSQQGVWEAMWWLALTALVAEARAALHLTALNLAAAQTAILALADLVAAFPTLLASLRPATHILAGLYAQSAGRAQQAAQQFVCAMEAGGLPQQQRTAALHAAALEVGAGTATGCSRAIDILTHLDLYHTIDPALPSHHRAAALFLSGMILMQQGQEQEGKPRLSKALKYAHSVLGNHQLVSQVLNVLAPIQARGDAPGAENMLTSSFTLSKNLLDLPAQIAALDAAAGLYGSLGDAEKQARSADHAQKKRQLVQQRLQEAAARSTEHHRVFNWQLDK